MGEFLDATVEFPAVLFSFLLLVVIGYWVLVLAGGLGLDALDPDDGPSGLLAGLGIGGVPVTVVLSLMVTLAWFTSLAGGAFTDGTPARLAVLAVALLVAWLGTRLLVLPVRRLLPEEQPPSRNDFIGRMCVIRTRSVSADSARPRSPPRTAPPP